MKVVSLRAARYLPLDNLIIHPASSTHQALA